MSSSSKRVPSFAGRSPNPRTAGASQVLAQARDLAPLGPDRGGRVVRKLAGRERHDRAGKAEEHKANRNEQGHPD
jgi:hypothetical protein